MLAVLVATTLMLSETTCMTTRWIPLIGLIDGMRFLGVMGSVKADAAKTVISYTTNNNPHDSANRHQLIQGWLSDSLFKIASESSKCFCHWICSKITDKFGRPLASFPPLLGSIMFADS